MNAVNLIGYLGADFDVAYTQADKCYAKNSLAITKRFKNAKGNEESQTSWIPITIFGKMAETAYLHFPKGSQFACSGELITSTYSDSNGNNRTSFSVIVHKFYWLSGNKKDGSFTTPNKVVPKAQPPTQQNQAQEEIDYDNVDISESEMSVLPF
ncbi:single-stranded DNA-binding protein [Campylobacter sp. MIT 12-8780]|uniref:single-stranded DNA-binding protein n=1 Tax=unclassified Campylobacter TaxID=2593542 RepID=UPI0010F727EE|nr:MULTISPECIES: single-stranded DNA-binding protein [unclassified Campylobacter]NDJ28075.1 single-stranded DNA-binding protein [Campylobacter sp. MIT 19-121]TKX28256.1 single-stranded DNA-binding protein [Campylobacter sp. MIT 12-5580]TQR39960.1 single-stranded DNA-binding protein [Campylobacter sp. MIT 12-8780]